MDLSSLWLPTATALGLALLHSIWIGALLYALVKTILPFLASAGQRHNLAYLGLLGLAAGFVAAFYQNFDYAPVCENLAATSISLTNIGLNFASPAPETSRFEVFLALLPNLAPWVSLIYLFGLLPAAAYLLRDQRRVQFLRTNGLTDLPGAWSATIAGELAKHPATRQVTTYLSEHAREVMTLGFWSPVIVFPVALVNALSPEMARTILLHEIAHLRHYDHWLNYPQQFLRTLFFYHPAAHAFCRIIDREREHRCDDWVARRCQDRRTYATALVVVARTSINPSNTLVMSATKTPFSNRIQRLFQGEEQRSGHAAFSLLFVALLAAGHLSFTSLGADAGAVDCLEEQSKLDDAAAADFNPVIIDVDGQEINIPLAEELPVEAPAAVAPTPDPAATITFTADDKSFTGKLDFNHDHPAINTIPRELLTELSVPDSLPPAPVKGVEKRTIVIRDGGDGKPLFIVDGERVESGMNDLDPDAIKSVSVLKGNSAIAAYGPAGKDGVIIIETKAGKKAKTTTPDASETEKQGSVKKATKITVRSSFSENPLYIIDGQRVEGGIDGLVSPDEIDYINVLKGEAATTAYGTDGANGVVLIKTKAVSAKDKDAPQTKGSAYYEPAISGTIEEAEGEDNPVVIGIRRLDGTTNGTDDKSKVVVRGYKAVTITEGDEGAVEIRSNETTVKGSFTITGTLVEPQPEAETLTAPTVPEVVPEGAEKVTFSGEDNPVVVYPNPSKGMINFRNVPTREPLTVAVYSQYGEIVRQEKFNGANLNVDGLPTGNYLVVLTDGKQRWVNHVTITK